MERSKHLAALVLVLFPICRIFAQDAYRERIYQAFISGDMAGWQHTMDEFAATMPKDTEHMLRLLEYYYGYTAWLVGHNKSSEAKKLIARAEELSETIFKTNPQQASAKAFCGAFIGFQIGLNPLKAPFLGPKSIRFISEALAKDPDNIQATIENANALYYRPVIFGGDKRAAISEYEKAVRLLETQGNTLHNWNYLNLLTVLAQAYEETENPALAKDTYEKILKIEPHFSWVRDELYPKFLRRHR